jgi:hypothetical protein
MSKLTTSNPFASRHFRTDPFPENKSKAFGFGFVCTDPPFCALCDCAEVMGLSRTVGIKNSPTVDVDLMLDLVEDSDEVDVQSLCDLQFFTPFGCRFTDSSSWKLGCAPIF